MKLRTKIVLLTTVPVIILSIMLFVISSVKIEEGIFNEAYNGMHATALSINDIFDTASQGEYRLDEVGLLWKGDLNISDSEEIVDRIKKNTGKDVTVFFGDTRYLTTVVDESGNRQIGTTASSIVIETVLMQGNDYYNNNVDVLGTRYIAYYIPVFSNTDGETPVGMIFLGEEHDVVNQKVRQSQKTILIICLAVLTGTVVIALFFINLIMKALGKGISAVKQIGEGSLGISIEEKLLKRKDVIGDICRSINSLDKNLSSIVRQIQIQCVQLNKTATGCFGRSEDILGAMDEINQMSQDIANTTTSQARDAASAGENVTSMGVMIEDTSSNIGDLMRLLEEMGKASKQSRDTLEELNQSMQAVKNAVTDITEKTSSTHESVQRIGDAANVITEIASQTNLLSLNASIEAARAGEQGRGFAVVAAEIQKLAEQSNQSALDIQTILNQLTMDSESSVNTMGEVSETISVQEKRIDETNRAFSVVENGIQESVMGISRIEGKTQNLDIARNDTITVVQNVAATAEENAASTEETAATIDQVREKIEGMTEEIQSLNKVIKALYEGIEVFKL